MRTAHLARGSIGRVMVANRRRSRRLGLVALQRPNGRVKPSRLSKPPPSSLVDPAAHWDVGPMRWEGVRGKGPSASVILPKWRPGERTNPGAGLWRGSPVRPRRHWFGRRCALSVYDVCPNLGGGQGRLLRACVIGQRVLEADSDSNRPKRERQALADRAADCCEIVVWSRFVVCSLLVRC